MGRRPHSPRTRTSALLVWLCIGAFALTGASASGKRPDFAGGPHGSPDAPGHVKDQAPQQPALSAPVPAATSSVAAPKPGRGHGHRQAAPAAAASAPPAASQPSAQAPAPAASPAAPAVPAPQPAPAAGGSAPVGTTPHRGAPRRSHRGHGQRAAARRPGAVTRTAAGRRAAAPASPRAAAPSPRATHRPSRTSRPHERTRPGAPTTVLRTLERVVRVVPPALEAAVIVLAFLLLVAAAGWVLLARTNRYLERQRRALLREVGVLQAALLPELPEEIGGLRPSVAYLPAEGPAAGGDFYDAFPLEDGRVGVLIGDVSGHGRDALMRTSLIRHTLRAYLDGGLEPRAALQVAGRVLGHDTDELATVILATWDPSAQRLRYAGAGHPPPVFVGPPDHVPVTRASSPPIGAGMPTGLRQTTVSVPHGSAICLFTDGLIEARRDGRMIGRLGLVRIISSLGDGMSAQALLERVAAEADGVQDDMAACLFRVEGSADVDSLRVEELELMREDVGTAVAARFLAACGIEPGEADLIEAAAERTVERYGRALVRITLGREGIRAEVLPANVESLAGAAASRGAA
jgi:hypothetical protein